MKNKKYYNEEDMQKKTQEPTERAPGGQSQNNLSNKIKQNGL